VSTLQANKERWIHATARKDDNEKGNMGMVTQKKGKIDQNRA
jgi:hypothetical protein